MRGRSLLNWFLSSVPSTSVVVQDGVREGPFGAPIFVDLLLRET